MIEFSAFRFALLGAAWIAACASAAPVKAADEPPIRAFLAVALSPDGSRLAAIEGDTPPGGGRPVIRDLVIRALPDGAATKIDLPCGRVVQCWPESPAWSPDGKHLSFALRKPGSHARALYELATDGNRLTEILSFDGTIINLKYGPDGRLAVLATQQAAKEVGAVEAGAPVVGDADLAPAEQRIAVVVNGALQWASPAEFFVYEYDWLPDGSGFVGTAAPGDGDNNWWIAKLYAFDSKGGSRVIYTPPDRQHQIASPRPSADGRQVYFISGLMSDFGSTGGDVFAVPVTGGAATDLTPGMPATAKSITLSCDGKLIAEMLQGDLSELVQLEAGRPLQAMRKLWSGQEDVAFSHASFACGPDEKTAIIHQSFVKPPELAVGSLGHWQDVTRVNSAFKAVFTVQSTSWTSDGAKVQGWLMLPEKRQKPAHLAMITQIHGGPSAAATPAFPSQLDRRLLAEGYALFLPNPRGSYGQGLEFQAANVRDFGHGDLRDILAGIDAVEKIAPIDEAKLGIMGHSYGGFMTMWTITQTNRFKVAVAGAGIANWQSYYGENGIDQWMIPFFGASVYDDPAIYAQSAPITFINQVQTPAFLWVGQFDVECPAAQTQEFWHALKARQVPVSMVIYPNEGHRMVDPSHISDAEGRTVAWFDHYLH